MVRGGGADSPGGLGPLAGLSGVPVESLPGGILRVRDPDGMPGALGAALPGERERACELITPAPGPFHGRERAHAAPEALPAPARALGFTVPAEAAVHVHLDAAARQDADTLSAFLRRLAPRLPGLRSRVGTNPRCRRLGSWPPALLELVSTPAFPTLPWPTAAERLRGLGLSRYVDLNLRSVTHGVPGRPASELRVLPGTPHTGGDLDRLEALMERLASG